MSKRHPLLMKAWGLRTQFNSLIVVLVAGILVIVISISGKYGTWLEAVIACENLGRSPSQCDLFSGKWVFDNVSYPLYLAKQCSFMSDELACEKFGRTDLKYQNWRWQPHQCNLPRFNATALLERLRDKRLVFVGDSLNRGQWVSMVCLLDSSLPHSHKSMQTNGSLRIFKVLEYNASIEFYWAPLLVESNSDHPFMHRVEDRIVRQSIKKHAMHWTDADILVFNAYLWWRRDNMTVLWGSFEEEDGIAKTVEILRSYEMALSTWSNWIEFHVDPNKTRVFFMSFSPTHQRAIVWGGRSGQNCFNETDPITREDGYGARGSDDNMVSIVVKKVEELRERGLKVQMINITEFSQYRKDGHPSIYRKQWNPLTEEQQSNPTSYSDCIHWCLPGVPDAWNELLYAHIFFK